MYRVAISTGHSNLDSGAIACDGKTTEFSLNVKIVDRLMSIMGPDQLPVIWWRSDLLCEDLPVVKQLSCNIKTINLSDVDCCVEIHHNACANPSIQGGMVLYWDTSQMSQQLAHAIAIQMTNIEDIVASPFKHYWRHVQRNFYDAKDLKTIKHVKRRLAFLGKTKKPAALVEVSYISNRFDFELAQNFASDFAIAIRQGILNWLEARDQIK